MGTLYNPNALTFRQTYNPLVGLTLGRVVQLFNQAEQGFLAELQWLFKFVEKREAVLKAVMARRSAALKKLDWAIKVKKDYEEGEAQDQQEYLEQQYQGIDNLKDAITFLSLAEFRGYSHVEKHYNPDGDVFHLEPVPQWLWARHLPSKDWLFNEKALQTSVGVPIDLQNFIIRECAAPVDEIATIAFLRKNLSQKDWDGFIETYGLPPIFIELPQNAGGGTSTDAYQQICEQIISDSRGVLPNGAKVQIINEGQRGASPFDTHIKYQDEQIVMAATGGLLTTLNQPTGLGSSQGEVHQDAFFDLAKAEAVEISEVFQKQFDSQLLNEEFESEDAMVYFEIAYQEVDTTETVIQQVLQLSQAGYKVDVKQLSEKTGYELSDAAEQQMEQTGFYNRRTKKAFAKDVEPITNAVRHALSVPDEKLLDELEKLNNSLPELLKESNHGERASREIKELLTNK